MYWCNVCDGVFEYPEEQDNSDYIMENGHKFINAVSFTEVCPFCKTKHFGDNFKAVYKCNDCENIFTEFKNLGHECCPECRSIDFEEMEEEECLEV